MRIPPGYIYGLLNVDSSGGYDSLKFGDQEGNVVLEVPFISFTSDLGVELHYVSHIKIYRNMINIPTLLTSWFNSF